MNLAFLIFLLTLRPNSNKLDRVIQKLKKLLYQKLCGIHLTGSQQMECLPFPIFPEDIIMKKANINLLLSPKLK